MVRRNETWRHWLVADVGAGRSWTMGELRSRDWDSLHQLWWICAKERNRLATEKIERNRLNAGYGDYENQQRDKTVQETMKAILDTLAERHQAYLEAVELAKSDPTIDLSRTDGPHFIQEPYVRSAHGHVENQLTMLTGPIRGRRCLRGSGACRGATQRSYTASVRGTAKRQGNCMSVIMLDWTVIHMTCGRELIESLQGMSPLTVRW
jgi:hypothetical protein